MSAGDAPLTEGQRRALAVRIKRGLETADALRSAGLTGSSLDELAAVLERIRVELGVEPATPPPHELRGRLASLAITACELRPSALVAYGAVAEEAAPLLERASADLERVSRSLLDELEGAPAREREEDA